MTGYFAAAEGPVPRHGPGVHFASTNKLIRHPATAHRLAALRQAVQENRYLITTHALRRMGLRPVSHEEIKYVIAHGDVIEQHPGNLPDPKILLMSHVRDEPLYVSCAFDGRYAYIVTVHWYDPARWIDPWTRK